MSTLSFFGAAGQVTGSNFLLEANGVKILIDCGLFQGEKETQKQNKEPFAFDPKEVKALVLTHAHLDHCGRIPKLWKDGFRGIIYATPATRDLALIIMQDAAELMAQDDPGDEEPLYNTADVAGAAELFQATEYRVPVKIKQDLTVELFDAGHILGSSTVLIESEGKKIVFSGDIGNHPVPIVREPDIPSEADVVVMETTYGNRLHEDTRARKAKLRSVIRKSIQKRGVLLIPAFALERTQELLYELNLLLEHEEIPPVPVFLDSPLAIEATKIYYQYSRYYDEESRALQESDNKLFDFPTLQVTETSRQSKDIAKVEAPKIIIAGSGMMEGGRIIFHARDYLADPRTTLLIVGYQAVGTLGRALFDGRRRVKILNSWVSVKAHVVAIQGYSAHADQNGLKHWLHAIAKKPKIVYLVHSEQESATEFSKQLGDEYSVKIPTQNEKVEL